MATQSISVMEFRKRIGDVLSRVHYTGEQFVIERNGEPIAAIVGLEDLKRLRNLDDDREQRKARWQQSLADADALRATMLARRHGEPVPSSTDEIREMRDSRDDDHNNLR